MLVYNIRIIIRGCLRKGEWKGRNYEKLVGWYMGSMRNDSEPSR
jgi:hypothetical protein